MHMRALSFTVLSVLLSLLGLAAVAGPSAASADGAASPSTSAKKGIPRTYDHALQHFKDADGGVMKLRRFESPSGNIYCAIKAKNMPVKACEINEGAVKDPAVCDSEFGSDRVGRIEFWNHRATPVCNTDTIREPGARTLPYGSKARYPKAGVKCLSESIGMTCISLKKTEGFFLRRGEYVIFNAG